MKLTGYNSVRSWAVAVACSIVMLMNLMPLQISGLLFVVFLDRYDTDRQTAALFGVISGVLKCFSGPFIGYLGEVFELRSLAIVGSLFSALGMGMCFFAEDIISVTLSLGIIYGIGLSLAGNILSQLIKPHFTKNIANANGVMCAGSGIGTLAIVPLITFLLDSYGVSGTLLLISGIMLHCVPVAMFLRDPKYKKTEPAISAIELEANNTNQNNSMRISEEHINPTFTKSIANDQCVTENITKSVCYTNEYQDSNMSNNQVELENIQPVSDKCGIENSTKSGYYDTNEYQGCSIESFNSSKIELENIQPVRLREDAIIKVKYEYAPANSNIILEEENKYSRALKTLSILKDPSFLIIMVCNSIHSFIYVFVVTIIIDYSRDKGIPHKQEQFFLMVLPVAQTVGYTCLGWVTDKGFLSCTKCVAAELFCLGVSCFLLVLSNGFYTMAAAFFGFGIFVSSIFSASPGLVYECIEEEKHTMAITSRMFLFGPLSFAIAPMIGYFKGTLGSYDRAIYLLAAFSVLCTALLLLLPCIARCTNRRKTRL